jgi:Zn-dependent M28 family amino/carboxypeptidase
MRIGTVFSLATALALGGVASAQAPVEPSAVPTFTPEAFRAHVAFLADDLLQGRDAGSVGYEIAARYVASRFEALGLRPAGTPAAAGGAAGWYQQVPFVTATLADAPARVTIGDRVFANGDGVLVRPYAAELAQTVAAGAVFAGYGLDAPAQGFDDYRGLDVRGKWVAILGGYPEGTPSEIGAHLNAEKARMAERRGAIGVITLLTPAELARRPWARRTEAMREPSLAWTRADGAPFSVAPGIRGTATFDTAASRALFAGASRSFDAVAAEAARPGAKPRGFALKTPVRLERQTVGRRITSPNVLAVLPGSDPKLANEYVLLMAHLDHVGVNPAKLGADGTGDAIYNGAMDNATGTATMLEVARAMAASPDRPRRSILFAAVTAEEKGLLGAEYLAKHSVVGNGKVVGVVNLDMPVLLYPFTDVIAFGANHSTLGPIVQRAAAGMNVKLTPDPLPAEGLFTRSDHYKFVREGIPSVFLMTGFEGQGAERFKGFLATHYHQPSDDLKLPIDWNAGARFAEINFRIAREIANADAAPRWNADSFFNPAAAARPAAAR